MKRKEFLKNSLYAGAAITAGKGLASTTGHKLTTADLLQTHDFKLKYSPHFGMFRHHAGDDLIDQLTFMADVGFRGLEDNGTKFLICSLGIIPAEKNPGQAKSITGIFSNFFMIKDLTGLLVWSTANQKKEKRAN